MHEIHPGNGVVAIQQRAIAFDFQGSPTHVRNALVGMALQPFNGTLEQSQAIVASLITAFEQKLQPEAYAQQGTVVVAPIFEMGNQSCGSKVFDRWIEGANPRKNQGVDRLEVLWTLHKNCLFAKPFKGLPHGVEIAHAVIDHTKVQAQSINPFEKADASEVLRNCA